MSNHLGNDKKEQVIRGLLEGASVRSVERMTGVHRDTILRLMVRVGEGSQRLLDDRLQNLSLGHVQLDELWSFVGKKKRHIRKTDNPDEVGDSWTWVAIDADTKLVPTHLVGQRTREDAERFVNDLASRLDNRVQLSADKLPAYVEAVWKAFGPEVDFAQIVKSYEADPIGEGRYSPPRVVSVEKRMVWGNPVMQLASTSFVERQNLTMRMHIRRLTRLTNAFSKKLENHRAAIAMWFGYYNFVRVHQTLKTTPAVATGLERWNWKLSRFLEEALAL
ncbi:MAG: IS1 family transposase [Anaerolineales bacterium]